MASHSSILAWRIPGMGEPGGLPSMGLHSRTRLKRLSSSSSSGDSVIYVQVYVCVCVYIYIYIFVFNILFHYGLSQEVEYTSLC